jgi:acetolactate synthase I/II/III large subunit
LKLSDYVVDFLTELGIKHVFMLPGGGAMHLNDSLGKNKSISYTCNLHEQAAAIAADAYAQCLNDYGAVMVTTGPGGTNTITGLTASWLDSIPVFYISGQVKTADIGEKHKVRQMGFQEVEITKIVAPITKYAVTVTDPKTIRFHLEKAAFLAKDGRPGPVWIDIPLDIQAVEINPSKLEKFEKPVRKINSELDHQINETISLLSKSKRPVILVGNGVRLAGALQDFLKLIKIMGIPVLTTWKSIDFIAEDHPLYIGRPGGVGQRGANFSQQTSDLILIIGARLDLGQTAYNHKNFAPHAKKIMVDIDPNEIKKMDTKIDLPITVNAKEFISGLLKQKSKIQFSSQFSNWLKHCKSLQSKYPVILPEYWKQKKYVNDYVLIDVLSKEMSKTDLLIPGSSGACSERSMQAFMVKEGMTVFNSEALGSMGFGLAMALGGCIASGKKRTVSIEGDGGFIMNVQELELVRRMKLPIKFFILNNQGYVSIQTSQKNYFESRFVASTPKSGLTIPSYKKIATAFGIPYVKIANHKNITKTVRSILKKNGPVLCEVMVSPDQTTQPRISSKKLPDGKMISLPMEDLWPFLDRTEFDDNMSVINKF